MKSNKKPKQEKQTQPRCKEKHTETNKTNEEPKNGETQRRF